VIKLPLEDLLVDKEVRIENFVKKAKDLIGIDKESGEVIILTSISELTDRHKIGLYLIGKFFASEMKKAEGPAMTYKELEELTGIDYHTIAARMNELKREGYVRSRTRGEWEIVFPKIGTFLDEVRAKLGLK